MWVWLLVGFAVLVIGLVMLGGCVALLTAGSSSDNNSTTTSTTPAARADSAEATPRPSPSPQAIPTTPTPGRMNTPISDGAAGSFVVSSVETGIPSVGEYLTDTAQGAFAIITVTVTNTSNHSIDFNASEQHVRDANNRVFRVDGSATSMASDGDAGWFNDINPGNSVTVRLVYDMPKDAVPATISLRASGGRPALVALR